MTPEAGSGLIVLAILVAMAGYPLLACAPLLLGAIALTMDP